MFQTTNQKYFVYVHVIPVPLKYPALDADGIAVAASLQTYLGNSLGELRT